MQVVLATINKNVMWLLYSGELWPEVQSQAWYKVAAWISYQFWFDAVVDLATVIFFGAATLMAFRVVLN